MPRRTRDQTDAEIVDRASALFARHGFRHTSLQQVADEVGYSKAGLLYRFPSKDAIHLAAVRSARERTASLVERVAGVPAGIERDRALVEALVDATLNWPGTAAFLSSVVASAPEAASPELLQAGTALAGAFGLGPESYSDERLVRVLSATAGIQSAADAAVRSGRERELLPHIITAAMDALGHRT
ncbi:TetR/AcrR family transcriptional regulator [Pseudonocardia sp. KRD291]|uniref:TetR/AcrR family transcriptional regulator n=1 Tax=Pseudonocardia sp. KRD291 TaxID=2792007 RepID=UPI001C4A0B92|nr:TetR/AcrR family transcriptional regulator [Pseudonocardia sp. KRD291]MBW0102181.1 TetR family transcriptional regulator [Pseudonocardia sp. KRD291]